MQIAHGPGPDGAHGPRGPAGPTGNAQLNCEECIKYWLHFLNSGGVNDLMKALIDAINEVNWGIDPACTPTTIKH